MVNKTKATD